MTDFNPNPVVTVRYTKNGDLKLRCPFCCKEHLHGPGADVRGPDFGHRLAHCNPRHLPPALLHVTLGYHLELAWEQAAEISVFGRPRAVPKAGRSLFQNPVDP